MAAVYPHTPEHHLSQQFKAEGITPSLSRAIAEVLKGEVEISKSGSRPEEVILRTAMTGLGLLKSVRVEGPRETFTLVEPTNAHLNSQKIWQLYLSHLSGGKPWHKLIDTLRSEPYGLYDSLLIAFTAAFCAFYADGIDITSATGQPSVLDEKALKALIDSPKSYNVRLQPLTGPEKQWLRGVVTSGLKRPFDASGGQGKTLRSRVAAQVKSWLSGLRLPLFAEKLAAEQLSALMPDSAAPIVTAAVVLLQVARTDEAIASTLLKEIPSALQVPEHSEWTNEHVAELLAMWAETCRFVERLPDALEQHATRSIAAVFGCEEEPAESYWSNIYRWRLHRQIVQNRVEHLPSQARTFFRLSSQPGGTIREAFLEEFPRTIIGINTDYQMWPTLNHLDRLVKEIQKARDDVDTRWRTLASVEDVWNDGLASAALGRPLSGVSADAAAKYLHEWANGITWPSCALALQPTELHHFYPTLDTQACADVGAILSRTQHQAEDWKRELGDALPRQFGVEGWTKAEVERAVARLGVALKRAANLDALLRKHILLRVLKAFTTEAAGTVAAGDILRQWRDAHPIPAENDLDANAQIALGQIDSSSDAETTLLITLPRALPQIAQSYQQWRAYADLERYVETVALAVNAIANYTPLTNAERRWLTGVVTEALRRQFISPPHEKHRLALAVGAQVAGWLHAQGLPSLAATLTATELRDLFPEASPPQILSIGTLLGAGDQLHENPTQVLLTDLPATLGNDAGSDSLSESSAESLLLELGEVCGQIRGLNDAITRRLLDDIGPIFGIEAPVDGAGTLVAKLRSWRQSYVIFANEALSPDAALVSEALSAPIDDPLKLLLTTLPCKLREVRAPYGSWHSWEQRTAYLQSLKAAAMEIVQRGQVSDATPQAQAIWERLKTGIADLSRDEQRWLIKVFSEEFRV